MDIDGDGDGMCKQTLNPTNSDQFERKTRDTDLSKMRCCLYFSDWLHESVSHDDADVSAGVPIRPARQVPEVGLHQVVWRLSQIQFEQVQSSRLLGQGNVNSLLKSINDRHKVLLYRCMDRYTKIQ